MLAHAPCRGRRVRRKSQGKKAKPSRLLRRRRRLPGQNVLRIDACAARTLTSSAGESHLGEDEAHRDDARRWGRASGEKAPLSTSIWWGTHAHAYTSSFTARLRNRKHVAARQLAFPLSGVRVRSVVGSLVDIIAHGQATRGIPRVHGVSVGTRRGGDGGGWVSGAWIVRGCVAVPTQARAHLDPGCGRSWNPWEIRKTLLLCAACAALAQVSVHRGHTHPREPEVTSQEVHSLCMTSWFAVLNATAGVKWLNMIEVWIRVVSCMH